MGLELGNYCTSNNKTLWNLHGFIFNKESNFKKELEKAF